MDYSEFFSGAAGHPSLPYQQRFRSETANRVMLRAPTGVGKTDAVLVAWLNRRLTEPSRTPRRLVWCLPGRALTEQVFAVAQDRTAKAGMSAQVRICRLLGGSADNDLTLRPDESAILVGTQDLLLSRALNRGYARRPLRWPIDFALLNNDSYWVLDDVQLLGDGLATSTQLAAFRDMFGSFGPAQCCWISATFDSTWLRTVDFAPLTETVRIIEADDEDRANLIVQRRLKAAKALEPAPRECRLPAGAAEFCASNHRPGTLSLVVVNTVARAREIRAALEKITSTELVLLHSRFRARDRAAQMARLNAVLPTEGRIVIATQVIEAGIDISADLLLTDIAPYSSIVQRFGRVNRYGDLAASRIFWVDRPLTSKRKGWADLPELNVKEQESICQPYRPAEILECKSILVSLHSAAPDDLPAVSAPPPWEHVVRRVDLFDGTPGPGRCVAGQWTVTPLAGSLSETIRSSR
jgi:CRISPR-associated endonuclease/helicase Cas3